ncbi:coproporphyrinogen-III oxidase 1, chloroplastic isoform X1 [Physcomitrium patens]|uniref:coproporphyrinogen oxidase n=2 Tax=Physcomitrium patens TaxID=3218 RepID=A0A2K1IQ90_PHYPA|nr:coproporphyrinogen-III oxidase 1, chloroplastic-like isoform X2 [Physcomitrium patens]PNR31443.1 hypothetical protein PHYPA_025564 [Physcomitrium patens]|eukprot:XP_024358682.1 coproporphyrinogen-III oxidase 1, chloroplastic-like isoform X2 [Physcomitrella patens]
MAHCATTMQTMASGKCWLDVSLSARGLSAPIPPHVMAPILAVKPNVKSLCVSNFVRGIGSTIDVGRNLRLMPVLCSVKEEESSQSIDDEQKVSERPSTLLREGEKVQWDNPSTASMRARFESMIRKAQDDICAAVEAVDGSKFREDTWIRPGGGGGISRVLQDGNVWEKAGVNVSVVYGSMPPEAYRAAIGGASANEEAKNKAGRIPFFAAGVSSVMHPKNPMAPTVHFNYRYFETDSPQDVEGAPRAWWFGGGTDLTPSYLFEEDVKHFHQVQKQACDKHDPEFYPKFKKWCDDYFLIKHRGERRGLGGIFFDDLNDRDPEKILTFSTECVNSVIPAYIPLVEKRKDMTFTEKQKAWQQLRRGRYVEFNLVYDRGTTFGLKTGGRIESILMSLPLTARWEYDHTPEEGSEEWKLLNACRSPVEWAALEL